VKLLCTGDIHIGRRASRLPAFAAGDRRYSSAAAWEAIVALAIRESVDLLLLSGDVVDADNSFFEAFGPLERGLRQLADNGIPTVAVSGNHDFDVLPRLMQTVGPQRFRLLGLNGAWERFALERDNRPVLHVDGWSFPRRTFHDCPLETYRTLPPSGSDRGVPVIGLVHGDLDQPRSVYAPLALRDLQSRAARLWLLGHVHKHALYECDRGACVLYPGSPLAMDPGETGPHGPWLVELGRDGVTCRQVPISTVRYETLEVNLEGADDRAAVEERVSRAIGECIERHAAESGVLEALSLRLRLTGRCRAHREVLHHLSELIGTGELAQRIDRSGRLRAWVDKAESVTRPSVDLQDLSRANDPPGAVARMILALSDPAGASRYSELLQRARARMEDLHRHQAFAGLALPEHAEGMREGEDAPDAEAARRLLVRNGFLLLDALLAQKEPRA
jgi:DNA repair exonuclease SbcCD nuclease subunit